MEVECARNLCHQEAVLALCYTNDYFSFHGHVKVKRRVLEWHQLFSYLESFALSLRIILLWLNTSLFFFIFFFRRKNKTHQALWPFCSLCIVFRSILKFEHLVNSLDSNGDYIIHIKTNTIVRVKLDSGEMLSPK